MQNQGISQGNGSFCSRDTGKSSRKAPAARQRKPGIILLYDLFLRNSLSAKDKAGIRSGNLF